MELNDIPGEVHYIDVPDDTIGNEALERELVDKLIESAPVIVKKTHIRAEKKPIYQAAFLYPESHSSLLYLIDIPDDWKTFAHHMTILFGRNKDETIEQWLIGNMGSEVEMEATHIGRSADAIAVKISSYVPTSNTVPHITIAVPPGGKPYNSNKITEWTELAEPINLRAKIGPFYGK